MVYPVRFSVRVSLVIFRFGIIVLLMVKMGVSLLLVRSTVFVLTHMYV